MDGSTAPIVDFINDRKLAERRFRLQLALARYRCETCGAPWPKVVRTDGPLRYVKCRRCGATGKVCPQ